MKSARRSASQVEILEASLASGVGQAIAGWAAEYTHRLLESDPELRQQLQRNWLLMYKRIVQITGAAPSTSRRHDKRRRQKPRADRGA